MKTKTLSSMVLAVTLVMAISVDARWNSDITQLKFSAPPPLLVADGPEEIPPAALLVADGPEEIPPAGVLVADGPEEIPPAALLIADGPEEIPPAAVSVWIV
jgi:hypothetical protein